MKIPGLLQRLAIATTGLWLLTAFTLSAFGQETKPQKDQPEPQEPAIKIGTALVTVPVIATDRYGQFVTGLTKNDFTIREDGVAQKVETLYSEADSFSVALLIDTSRSTQNKLGAIRKAALAFIKQLQPRDRVMVVTFDEKVRFISDFTNNQADLERAVKSLKTSYLTSLYDAIHLTIRDKMSKVQGRKAIVVLSDGVDTASQQATFESTLDLVSGTGIICYAIQYETRNDGGPTSRPIFFPRGGSSLLSSVFLPQSELVVTQFRTKWFGEGRTYGQVKQSEQQGQQLFSAVTAQSPQPHRDRYLVAADFLRALAFQSGAQYIRAENIENTTYAFRVIAEELRHQYTLTYISSNEPSSASNNYRVISVNISHPEAIVRARSKYRAPRPSEPQ